MAANAIAIPEEIVDFKPGTRIWFGKEKTQWRVLEVNREEETALLIADKEICEKEYHKKSEPVTWETCTLRQWLNGDCYEKTFSDAEKEAVLETELSNPDNPKYNTKGGNATKDKVFLLSIEEAEKYFKNSKDRATGSWWWLRSPGYRGINAANVYYDGGIYDGGYRVDGSLGIRPAFKINLKSELFQSLICDSKSKNLKIRVPLLHIFEGALITGKPVEGAFEIPEGITELGDQCFAGWNKLTEVKLPSTLKKIGKEAFKGCTDLKTITGTNGAISYGKDTFTGCKNLQYTAEMFRNAGKLCDSFADHLDACGAKELAWLLMVQKGAVWEKNLPPKITKENAAEILWEMTEHIAGLKKSPKKAAEAAADFITKNVTLLTGDSIKAFCEALRGKKLDELADSLLDDPAVAALFKPEESSRQTEERVMPDGSILYGTVEEKVKVGSYFTMGKENGFWRILNIDSDEALVIAEKSVCERPYHSKYVDITWEKCDLRKWLNGEYYDSAFSGTEKDAILESEIQNPDNPQYKTKGGNPTRDKIFLLSIDEAKKYFLSDEGRATGSWWWLRSPGNLRNLAAYVRYDGDIDDYGRYVRHGFGIRPAFKINLKSDFFQSLISVNQNGEAVFKNYQHQIVIKAGEVVSAYRNVTEVNLPPYVKKIAARAFQNCVKLTKLTWQGKQPVIDKDAFSNCPNLQLSAEFYSGKKLPHENFAPYLPDDAEIIANIFVQNNADSAFLEPAIDRISIENAAKVTDAILKRGASIHPGILSRHILAVMPAINKEQTLKLLSLAEEYSELRIFLPLLQTEAAKEKPKKPEIEKDVYGISYAILKTDGNVMKGLPHLAYIFEACKGYIGMYGDGEVVEKEFKKAALNTYHKEKRADEFAASVNHAALMKLLKCWIAADGARWYAPYAAFANDVELSALLQEMKAWEKDKNLREQIIRVRGAVLLNDTVTAMRYADSLSLLERYAEMRNTDADSIRDNIISDFGLDENGRKQWTLAGKTITAVLNTDITLSLLDEDGKVLKSVPKKGAGAEEYEAVNKEFAAMKKDIKAVAKTRNDKIFADFLSGRKRSGKAWKDAYLHNPLLRMLARLIVWEQDGTTFTLKEDGKAYDVNGNEYTVNEKDIAVAHPMEMRKEDAEAWQLYFNNNGLKQPFEQVWEPVEDASLVKPGRYDGCTIPLYMLMNKEKHGIIMEGQSQITLKDCTAGLRLVEGHHDWVNNEFEVTDFRFKKYTRQVNHIVCHLDKGTVAGRVKKDDITVAQWLDRFTLAQIMGFIDLAGKSNAVNVSALLLQYKQEHFEEFDPMDEFTLDLL